MTDLTIKTDNAVSLKESIEGVLAVAKIARKEATELRTAIDEKVADVNKEVKQFGATFGDTKAKVDELAAKMAENIGTIGRTEQEAKGLLERMIKHEAAMEQLHAEFKRPKGSDQSDEDLRKEFKAAHQFYNIKHWSSADGQGLANGVSDLKHDFVTEERLAEYRLGKEVQSKMFRMGTSVNQGREAEFLNSAEERKALSTFTMGNRYWLQTELADRIISCYRLDTDMTQFVDNLTISRGAIELMTDHYVGQDAQWKCELDCLPKSTATEPLPGTIVIAAHELVADECITHTMIEDSAISPEEWLAKKIGGKFVRKINNTILNGDGNNKPDGILRPNNHLTMPSGNVAGTPAGDFTWQDLVLMSIKLEPRFRAQSVWWFGTNALAATATMTDSQGRPIWSAAVLNEEGLPRIMGKPVVEVTQMPDYLDGAGAKVVGSKPVALGDWKQAYMMVHRRGFTAMRDPYSMMQCGVRWHFSQRVGGGVLCRNASIFMQIA